MSGGGGGGGGGGDGTVSTHNFLQDVPQGS